MPAGGPPAVVIYDPNTGTGTFTNPINTTPFPNNIIPSNRIDPVAAKAMTYLPAPNRAPEQSFQQHGQLAGEFRQPNKRAYHTVRIDHELTAAQKSSSATY